MRSNRDIFLGYRRVSRVGERDERLRSPEYQAERLTDVARREGLKVEMLPAELDVSGGKESRAILDAAVERIERGEVAGLVVAQFDRLSRLSMARALALLERIESAGGRVVSAAEPLDPRTPEGEFQRNVMLSVAQMERARKAAGFETAKRSAIEAGRWTARRIPLGYVKGPDGRLAPDPETADLARGVFERRARGESWWTISHWLGEALDSLPGEYGAIRNGHVNVSRLMYMVRNRAYLGESRQGQNANPEAHPALVDRATWEAAQRKQPRQTRTGHVHLLAGLARCGACGYAMTVNSNGRGQRSYVCSRREMCSEPAQIQARILEPFVSDWYVEHLRESGATVRARRKTVSAELDEAITELAKEEGLESDWLRPEVQETLPLPAWLDGARERRERVERAASRVAELRAIVGDDRTEYTSSGAEMWVLLPTKNQRDMLRRAIAEVRVSRGREHADERVSIIERGAGALSRD